jgi:hypothetical protein
MVSSSFVSSPSLASSSSSSSVSSAIVTCTGGSSAAAVVPVRPSKNTAKARSNGSMSSGRRIRVARPAQ